jgi:hypothetical protein
LDVDGFGILRLVLAWDAAKANEAAREGRSRIEEERSPFVMEVELGRVDVSGSEKV